MRRLHQSGLRKTRRKLPRHRYRIEKTEDLLPTLKKAFQQDKPVIIDCPIDYEENMKLTAHLEQLMKTL